MELPAGNASELHQMISLQVEKEIPLPPDRTQLNYQVVSKTSAGAQRVIVAAVGKDVVEGLQATLAAAELKPMEMYLSSIAAQTALLSMRGISENDTLAIVDIGFTHTDVAILSAREPAFSRSASTGLASLMAMNPRRDAGRKSDPAADFTQAISEAEPCEWRARWTAQLASEISLSLRSFTSQKQDVAVQKLFVCGAGSRIPGLLDALSGRTGIPTSVIRPSDLSACETSGASGGDDAGFTVPVSLGLTHLVPSFPKLGLLAPSMAPRTRLAGKWVAGFAAAAVLVLLAIIGAFAVARIKEKALASRKSELEALAPKAKAVKDTMVSLSSARPWLDGRYECIDLLKELSNLMPDDVYLEELTIEENGIVKMSGRARMPSSATVLFTRMDACKAFKKTATPWNYIRTNPDGGEFGFDFSTQRTLTTAEGKK
jgi:type IV pilus assembly protein PilM